MVFKYSNIKAKSFEDSIILKKKFAPTRRTPLPLSRNKD